MSSPSLADPKENFRRHALVAGCGILLLGALCFWPALNAEMQGDVRVYSGIANDLIHGKLPYRDRVVEYPPYAVPLFLLPRLFGNERFLDAFLALAFAVDLLIKIFLLLAGTRIGGAIRSLAPLALYAAAVPFLGYFYLQRYDVWPALVSLIAIGSCCRGRFAWSGAALAIGIGIKLYPAVFVPPLFFLAAKAGKARAFVSGLCAGLLPILLLGAWLPWWRFAEFQSARGLQVESIYASLLWLANLFGAADVSWKYANKWYEVRGTAADVIMPWARGAFTTAVLASAAFVSAVAIRAANWSTPRVARLLLVPLLAFVAFNPVLSPQFLIWLLPLAALATLQGNVRPLLAIAGATLLTPVIFPSFTGNYFRGLNLWETGVLVARNLALIGAWAALVVEWSLASPVPVITPLVRRLSSPRAGQFFKFCLVGASGVVVDMALLHVFAERLGWNLTAAKVAAAEAALLNNFFWNERWTFRAAAGRSTTLHRLVKFHLICGFGIALAVVLLRGFYFWAGWNLYFANLLAIVLVTLWNFFMNAIFNWRVMRRNPKGRQIN